MIRHARLLSFLFLFTAAGTSVAAQTKGIFINEFMARNKTVIVDEKGEYEDWVELYNANKTATDVGGMYMTDDDTTPTEWQIPANTMIPAGGTILIWLDNDLTDGPLHANFRLKGGGEEVYLFDKDGKTEVDSFEFGEQDDDVSTGRLFDGGDQWVTFPESTPKELNAPDECGARAFSALTLDAHRLEMELSGDPKINTKITLDIAEAPPSSSVLLFLGTKTGELDLGEGVTLLIGAPLIGPVALATASNGDASLPLAIPNDSQLVGLKFYLQAGATDKQGLTASNALEVTICK